MKSVSKGIIAVTLSALLMIVSACGGSSPAPASQQRSSEEPSTSESTENSLEELANEEGQVTVYCAASTDACQEVANRFNERYPNIEVQNFRQPGGVLFERLRTDAARGNTVADVWMHSDIATYLIGVEEGLVEPYETEHEFPDSYNVLIPHGYPAWVTTLAVGINTDLVNPEDQKALAASWDGVLDPKWKGKIATADPSQSGSVFNYFFVLKEQMGDEAFWKWLEGLSQQDVAIFDSAVPPGEAVARGEFAMALTGEHLFSQQVTRGAPVSVAYPKPVPGYVGVIGLVANAPHPNAAKLYLEWFISREGQAAFSEIYETQSAIPGLETDRGLSKAVGYEPPDEVFVTLTVEEVQKQTAEREEFLRRFSQIMGIQ